MAITAADIKVRFSSENAEGVKKDIEGVGSSTESLAQKTTALGGKLTAFATVPIAAFFGKAYTGAASLEQAYGKTDAVFGDMSGSMIQWSQNSATAFGMTQTQALSMAGTYGQIMQAQGMAQDQSRQYSQSLIGLAADMSAFSDVSNERSSLALQSALTGEYESLKQFGIVLKADQIEQDALNLAIANGRSEVTEADRVQARYNAIMGQTTQMQGQFARESEGASGQLAILRANLGNLTANLGTVLLPIGTRVTKMLNTWVQRLMKLTPTQQKWVVGIAAAAAAVGPLLLGIGKLMAAFSTMGAVLGAILSPFGLVVAAVGVLAYLFRGELMSGIRTAVDWFGQFVEIVRDVVSGSDDLLVKLFDMPQPLQALAVVVGTVIREFQDLLKVFREEGLSGLLERLPESLGEVGDAFGILGTSILNAVRDIDWGGVGSALWDGLLGIVGWIGGRVLDLGSIAVSVAGWLAGVIPDVWAWLRDTALPAIGAGIVSLPSVVVDIVRWAKGAIPDLWEKVKSWAFGGTQGDGTGGPNAPSVGGITIGEVVANIGAWAKGTLPDIAADILGWIGTVTVAIGNGLWNLVLGRPAIEGDLGTAIDQAIEGVVGRTWYYSMKVSLRITGWVVDNPLPSLGTLAFVLGALLAAPGVIAAVPVAVPLALGLGAITAGAGFVALVFNGIKGWVADHPVEAVEIIVPLQLALENGPNWLKEKLKWLFIEPFEEGVGEIVDWVAGWSWPSLSLPDLDFDWPSAPEPPAWMTSPPQWWVNVQAGRFPWDNGTTGRAGNPTGSPIQGPTYAGPDRAPTATGGPFGPVQGPQQTDQPATPVQAPIAEPVAAPSPAAGVFKSLAQGYRDVASAALQANMAIPPVNSNLLATTGLTPGISLFGTTADTSFSSAGAAALAGLMPIGGIASNMAGSLLGSVLPAFGGVSTSAQSNFASMQASVAGQTLAASLAASSNSLAMSTGVKGNMQSMSTDAAAKAAEMNRSVNAETLGMQVAALGKMALMKATSTLHFMGMAASAREQGTAMSTALRTGANNAVSAVSSALSRIPGIINGVAGQGAAAAYNAGSAIGAGFANGMLAYLGQIQSAASAMVAAASAAVVAKAMISSPSRLFFGYGEHIGEGMELGIRSMIPEVTRAAADMITAPPSSAYGGAVTPAYAYAASAPHQVIHYHDNRQFFALQQGDYQAMLDKAERGGQHAAQWQQPDAAASRLRPGRRR